MLNLSHNLPAVSLQIIILHIKIVKIKIMWRCIFQNTQKFQKKGRFSWTTRSQMTTAQDHASPTNDIWVTREDKPRHMPQMTNSVMSLAKRACQQKKATNNMLSWQIAICQQHFQLRYPNLFSKHHEEHIGLVLLLALTQILMVFSTTPTK